MADEEHTPPEGHVEVEDAFGNKFDAPAGIDGENPVSINNPLPGTLEGPPPDVKPPVDNASPSAEELQEIEEANVQAWEDQQKAEEEQAQQQADDQEG